MQQNQMQQQPMSQQPQMQQPQMTPCRQLFSSLLGTSIPNCPSYNSVSLISFYPDVCSSATCKSSLRAIQAKISSDAVKVAKCSQQEEQAVLSQLKYLDDSNAPECQGSAVTEINSGLQMLSQGCPQGPQNCPSSVLEKAKQSMCSQSVKSLIEGTAGKETIVGSTASIIIKICSDSFISEEAKNKIFGEPIPELVKIVETVQENCPSGPNECSNEKKEIIKKEVCKPEVRKLFNQEGKVIEMKNNRPEMFVPLYGIVDTFCGEKFRKNENSGTNRKAISLMMILLLTAVII